MFAYNSLVPLFLPGGFFDTPGFSMATVRQYLSVQSLGSLSMILICK